MRGERRPTERVTACDVARPKVCNRRGAAKAVIIAMMARTTKTSRMVTPLQPERIFL
ncbi:hypothetical protein [Marivivens marinus]|uniref:hypothetical protein n=1 Tax=Marivivens marinus TaxID=3110173 RepID=UPI003B8464AC